MQLADLLADLSMEPLQPTWPIKKLHNILKYLHLFTPEPCLADSLADPRMELAEVSRIAK